MNGRSSGFTSLDVHGRLASRFGQLSRAHRLAAALPVLGAIALILVLPGGAATTAGCFSPIGAASPPVACGARSPLTHTLLLHKSTSAVAGVATSGGGVAVAPVSAGDGPFTGAPDLGPTAGPATPRVQSGSGTGTAPMSNGVITASAPVDTPPAPAVQTPPAASPVTGVGEDILHAAIVGICLMISGAILVDGLRKRSGSMLISA